MQLIDEKFDAHEMFAFGSQTDQMKKEFKRLRKTHIDIFLKHMELQMDFAPDDDESDTTSSVERGQRFQAKFQAKEAAVGEITEMLTELGSKMHDISEMRQSAAPDVGFGIPPSATATPSTTVAPDAADGAVAGGNAASTSQSQAEALDDGASQRRGLRMPPNGGL
eukprot:g2165.t1